VSNATAAPAVAGQATAVIDVKGLTKRFGTRTVVDDFAIKVNRGQIYGFLGPNGSGKTTTIRMLCGLLTPDSGEGQCLGYNIRTEALKIKRHVGYMTQKFSLYEDLSIAENLDFIARVYEVPNRKQAVTNAIDRLGLTGRKAQLAGSLSGGWKQRLALAACLLHDPKLLLLDEPTAGVDPKARREFWDQIHELAAEGLTVLVSTHYMDEAERCHELAYIAYGKLLAKGTAAEVVAQSGLSTWSVAGPGLHDLARKLRTLPGVDMVVPFGTTLHVSGADAAKLEQAVKPMMQDPAHQWTRIDSGLEDVFIGLMNSAKDNFQ
jgi:ABC-2 type transport system ATP-binding protein